REIALKHGRRGNVAGIERGVRTLNGALIAAEEKQFIFDDRAAQNSAELIALQRVALQRKEVARVQSAISEEFEHITMKFVRTGFGNGVDGSSGMKAVLRREHAGLDFELLQGIRKRYRQREAVVWILVDRAVQIVRNRVALAAGHSHDDRWVIPHRVDG